MKALVPTGRELTRVLRRVLSGSAEARGVLDRALGIARARLVLRRCALGRNVYLGGDLDCTLEGDVTLGDRVCFFDGMLTSELRCHAGAQLSIGEKSTFNYGFSIEAHQRVSIGRHCMIASLVRITDSHRGHTAPVVIGDDVWIAHGAIIEPGVEIGAGAVISAGSVVTTSVPPGHLAMGNPARMLRLEALGGPSRGAEEDAPRLARSA
ncbi:MAG TPA: acyltransferase [Archangium sp.]|nr:acyltransferase [Archangium sp.]